MKVEEAVPDGKQAVQPPALMHAPRRSALLYRLAPIPGPRVVPGLTPWIPGTQGLYPRFLPVAAPVHGIPQFPVWNARIAGMQRQQAMFQLADEIEKQDPARGAFYVAADVWSMA